VICASRSGGMGSRERLDKSSACTAWNHGHGMPHAYLVSWVKIIIIYAYINNIRKLGIRIVKILHFFCFDKQKINFTAVKLSFRQNGIVPCVMKKKKIRTFNTFQKCYGL
jgi:hypothetical protein